MYQENLDIIVIEDEPKAQKMLLKMLNQYVPNCTVIGAASSLAQAIELCQKEVDLIFLDLNLPDGNGFDLLSAIPHPAHKIILTTAFSDYALQGYELDIVDYLLKPFSFERFVKAVSKVIYSKEQTIPLDTSNFSRVPKEKILFIKTGKDYQKIETLSIQFIKSNGDYTQLFTTEGKHLVSQPLKYWSDKLDTNFFCQIHKSYLINVHHISKVSGNQVYIGDNLLPIGRTFREGFIKDYLEGDE